MKNKMRVSLRRQNHIKELNRKTGAEEQNKIKSSLKEFNNRLQASKRKKINKFQDKTIEIIQSQEHKDKRMNRNEQSLRNLCDIIKCTKTHTMKVPKAEDKNKGAEKKFF